jgi:hypothetical protein
LPDAAVPIRQVTVLTSSRAAFLLRCLLIFNGVMTLLALSAVFLPTAWMDGFHRNLGLGPLPQGPIVEYLTRSVSALYAAFGSLTLVIAWDLRRFGPLVTWWGVVALVFGGILFWVDTIAPMPDHWKWGEAPYLLLTGAVVLVLQRLSTASQKKALTG